MVTFTIGLFSTLLLLQNVSAKSTAAVQIDISCFDGEIKPDVDTGFYQFCANGEWMVMPCAPGTIFDDTEYKCVADIPSHEIPHEDIVDLIPDSFPDIYLGSPYASLSGPAALSAIELFPLEQPYDDANIYSLSTSAEQKQEEEKVLGLASGTGTCIMGRNVGIDGSSSYQVCLDDGNGQGVMLYRECAPGTAFKKALALCGTHDSDTIILH